MSCLVLALFVMLAIAGCGGGDKVVPKAEAGPAVIRAWADSVRKGEFDRAAELFALPALVANGDAGQKLTTRADIDAFNRSFPCGAVLLDTQQVNGGRLLATFRLTDGFGPRDCGTGEGNRAKVTFRVRDGQITEWLRESTEPPPGSV